MKLEIAITRRQNRAIVAASLMAVSLISALWVTGDACAACNPVTIKVPAELVGKDDKTPLALKDGEYLIGTTNTIVGPLEHYVRIQKGEWAGLFNKVRGVISPVLPDAPAPPEVEKCIESVKPTSGIAPQLRDLFIPSAEAGLGYCGGRRCLAVVETTNCFKEADGSTTCYRFHYCAVRGTTSLCYQGRSWICRGTSAAFKCPAGTQPGITS